jgi:hypothetical protein
MMTLEPDLGEPTPRGPCLHESRLRAPEAIEMLYGTRPPAWPFLPGDEPSMERIVAVAQASHYATDVADLLDEIRDAIEASDETRYRIAKGSGVSQGQLSRLMSGEQGLSVANVQRLAEYLGLEIIVRSKRRTRKAK